MTDQRRGRSSERAVIELARMCGWRVFHVSDSRKPIRLRSGQRVAVGDRDAKGFPDFVFCHARHGRFLIRELKTGTGRLTPEQRDWLSDLATCGVDAGVWRLPDDWPLVEATLKGGAAPTPPSGQPAPSLNADSGPAQPSYFAGATLTDAHGNEIPVTARRFEVDL